MQHKKEAVFGRGKRQSGVVSVKPLFGESLSGKAMSSGENFSKEFGLANIFRNDAFLPKAAQTGSGRTRSLS